MIHVWRVDWYGNMCSNQMKGTNDETITSDNISPAMLASLNFDAILEQVQTSGLNFQIQISPFSAMISLRKSLIKDKCGKLFLAPHRRVLSENMKALNDENINLKNEMINLTKIHSEVVKDYENGKEIIKSLETALLESKIKTEEGFYNSDEIESLKKALEDRDNEIFDLKIANKTAKEASDMLNKKLVSNKNKYDQEKSKQLKEHRNEVKALKKDLGEANRKIVNLEKKLIVADKSNKPEQKDENIPPYLSTQSCSSSSSLPAPPCTLPSSKQASGSSHPLSTFQPSTPTRSPAGSQSCMPTSPHTPPGSQPPSTPSTSQPVQPATTSHSALISADYILGINEIDLGPRVNDLSKM